MFWDERDRYSKEDWRILEQIDAEIFGVKIYITELDTVFITGANDVTKEMLFDEFIKKIEAKVSQETGAIKYDNETNKFYLVELEDVPFLAKKKAFELDINEDVMEAYAFGKYNKVTSKLHELYLKSMTNKEKQDLLAKKEQERNEVITKMNTSHDLPTPAEARIYLDYLEEMERTNAKTIIGDAKSVAATTAIPLTTGTAMGLFATTIADATATSVLVTAAGVAFTTLGLMDLYLMAKKDINGDTPFVGSTSKKFIKDSIKDIKEKRKDNKVIRAKASKLYEIENMDKMVMAKSYFIEEFDNTLTEEDKLESLNLKNSIMKNLDEVVNRINLLNPEDKMIFLEEAQAILAEYTERYKEIVNQDKNIIILNPDSFVKLKIDILAKIADLEMKIAEVRQKDVQIKQVTDESRMLTDKIEGFSDIDIDLQRVQDITKNKVKVKKLTSKEKTLQRTLESGKDLN